MNILRLLKNATRKARDCGEKRIAAKDIRKVTTVCRSLTRTMETTCANGKSKTTLRRFKG